MEAQLIWFVVALTAALAALVAWQLTACYYRHRLDKAVERERENHTREVADRDALIKVLEKRISAQDGQVGPLHIPTQPNRRSTSDIPNQP